MGFNFGFIPSPDDERDFVTTAIIPRDTGIERKFQWESPLMLNQYQFGTCVGFAGAGIKNIEEKAEGTFVEGGFSPLFIYTMCKLRDGIPFQEGTYPRVALDVLRIIGVVPESELPYSLLKDINMLPLISADMQARASKYKISTYARIPNGDIEALKRAIRISPVMAGINVYENFFRPIGGLIQPPSGALAGGHGVHFTGYDDDMRGNGFQGFVTVQNSWGKSWGKNGIGYIPYDLLRNTYNGKPFCYEMWSCVDAVTPKPVPPTPPKPDVKKLFKVQVGAFKVKENAQKKVAILKAKGFPTYLPPVSSDGLYRVQIGAFAIEGNAIKLKKELRDAGFLDAFIVVA